MKMFGEVTFAIQDSAGNVIGECRKSNVIVSGGFALVRDYLLASNTADIPRPPSYIGFGSGQEIPHRFHTQAQGETYRIPITSYTKLEGNRIQYQGLLGTGENNNQTIANFSLWGGDATGTAGTGTLFSSTFSSPFEKVSANTVLVQWTITVSGRGL